MMTSNLDKSDRSDGDRAKARAYVREFIPAMLAYCVVIVVVLTFGDLDGSSPWRFVWAVLPVLPLIGVAVAVIRHVRRLDDYQQRLNLQAFGVGFAVAMGAAITVGLLQSAGLSTRAGGWIIFGAGMAGWGVTAIVVARRG
jgi:hypothetical protein